MFIFVFLTITFGIGVIVLQEDIWEKDEELEQVYRRGYEKGYEKGISVNFIKYDEDHKED